MRAAAARHFREATGSGKLQLAVFCEQDGQVVEGILQGRDGAWIPIIDGVPSFVTGAHQRDLREFAERHGLQRDAEARQRHLVEGQVETTRTFSKKWKQIPRYGFAPEQKEFLLGWFCKKVGVADQEELAAFYRCRRHVLEVGPGSGFHTRFIAEHCAGEVFALDISDAAQATYQNTLDLKNCTIVQADLMAAPFADEFFDLIIADGVLHHTPDTRAAVQALYRKVAPGGQFFFHIYRKMGPARQFCDSYIRERFTGLDADECYAACEGLTELGRELSRLGAKITLERPIPVLGIPAGVHDVQRLLYYNFVKCFWNDAFDFATNNMVNFDWYHPRLASQHGAEEVAAWLDELGVKSYRFHDANPNGISVLLTKPERTGCSIEP